MNSLIIISLAAVCFLVQLSFSEAGDITYYDDCNACTGHGMGCESTVRRACTQKYELPNGEVKYACETYITKYICSEAAHKDLPIPDVQPPKAADFKAVADKTTYYDDCKPCESSGLGCKFEVRHVCTKKLDLPNGNVKCIKDKYVTKYICKEPEYGASRYAAPTYVAAQLADAKAAAAKAVKKDEAAAKKVAPLKYSLY